MQELYDLEADVGETTDLAVKHPDVVKDLLAEVECVRTRSGDDRTHNAGQDMRAIGVAENPRPLTTFDPSHPYMVAMYDGKAG